MNKGNLQEFELLEESFTFKNDAMCVLLYLTQIHL